MTQDQNLSLDTSIFDVEIVNALKDLNENKTPGPDGFNSRFFLHYWDIVGTQFIRVVHYLFDHSKLSDCFKHNLITLIPKSNNA